MWKRGKALDLIAAAALSIAAQAEASTLSIPPKFQGEWCEIEHTPNLGGFLYELCRDAKPEKAAKAVRFEIEKDKIIRTAPPGRIKDRPNGAKDDCRVVMDQPENKLEGRWIVHATCKGNFTANLKNDGLQTFALERRNDPKTGAALLHAARQYGRNHLDFVDATRREAEIKRQAKEMEKLYNEPKP